MKQYLTIAILTLALAGCCAPNRCPLRGIGTERTVEVRDSVIYVRDSILVPVPQEDTSASAPLGDTSYVRTSLAEAVAWIEDGQIRQWLRNRSDQVMKVEVDLPRVIHVEKEYLTRTVREEVVKPLTWLQKTLMCAGGTALGVLALLAAWKFITKTKS